MGCAYNIPSTIKKKKIQSLTGVLQLEILLLHFSQGSPISLKDEFFVKLTVSNQVHVISSIDMKAQINEMQSLRFNYIINSLYKVYGRVLIIQIWNSKINKYGEETKCFGIIDLSQKIKNIQQSQSLEKSRCFLNNKENAYGYIDLKLSFRQINYYQLNLSIIKVDLQSKINIKKLCYCKVTLGQQILESALSVNTQTACMSWQNQILAFLVPEVVQLATIQLIQKKNGIDVLICQSRINLSEIGKSTKNKLKFVLQFQGTLVGYIQLLIIDKTLQQVNQIYVQEEKQKYSYSSMKNIQKHEKATCASENTILTILTQKRLIQTKISIPPLSNNCKTKIEENNKSTDIIINQDQLKQKLQEQKQNRPFSQNNSKMNKNFQSNKSQIQVCQATQINQTVFCKSVKNFKQKHIKQGKFPNQNKGRRCSLFIKDSFFS